MADPSVVGASDSPMFTGQNVRNAMEQAARLQREQAAIPDRTPEEVKRSEELGSRREEATAGLRSAFDLWTAEPLGLDGARHTLETHADSIVEAGKELDAEVIPSTSVLSGQKRINVLPGGLKPPTYYPMIHGITTYESGPERFRRAPRVPNVRFSRPTGTAS